MRTNGLNLRMDKEQKVKKGSDDTSVSESDKQGYEPDKLLTL